MGDTLNFKTPSAWGNTFDSFKKIYNLKECIFLPENSNKREARNAKNKVCRFCGKPEGEVTFRTLPHKIPKLLGNNFWYNDDECDRCNALFHIYETNLGDFFGVDRPLQRVTGGGNYPKFKSPDKKLEVRPGEFYSLLGVYVKQNSILETPLKYDKETGLLTISTKLNTFIPLYVYKALLKIALSILPKDEILNYKGLIPFLLNPKATDIKYCPIAIYELHADTDLGFRILIFEKNNPDLKLPTHFCSIYWLNNVISFHLPNHKQDIWAIDTPIEIPIPPPLFLNTTDETVEKLKLKYTCEDFSSIDPVRESVKKVEIQMNPETMNVLLGKNMDTGEIVDMAEFDISKINGFFISKTEDTPTIYFDETKRH